MRIDYQKLLNLGFWGNSIESYLKFILISLIGYLIFKIVIHFVIIRLEKLAKRTVTKIDDFLIQILQDIKWAAFMLIILFSAPYTLQLSESIKNIIDIALIAIVTYEIIKITIKAIDFFTKRVLVKKETKAAQGQIIIFSKVIKVVIWVVGATLFLSNIGYDVTSIIAGLGIGSIAIALSVQNILSDMLSSFSIYFDKPFKIGDTIQVGQHIGNVESIGIKTTRIRTLQGEELVVPNKNLTNTELQNYGKLVTRRVVVNIGLRYDTSLKKIKKAKELISAIVKKVKKVELSRVHFKSFGDSALMFELVYIVESDDYNEYMDKQESINLKIMEAFAKEKIEFAFPTRTIVMEKG